MPISRALGEITQLIDYGVTASASNEPVGPKFLRITDIQDGRVDWNLVPWCECDARSARESLLQPGDIVFARTGGTTGKSFLIEQCPANAVFASYLIRVRLSDVAHPRYVSHYFQSPSYWSQISSGARGAAQPGVNATTLKSLQVPLPPLDDQKRIAHLLGKVEGLIAQRKQHLQQLDDLLKSVFLEMFGDPVKNDKGWEVIPFSEAGSFQSGGTPSKSCSDYWEGTYPWVSPKDMKRSYIDDAEDHISDKVFAETSLRRIDAGNILIVVRGMILVHSFPVAINIVPVSINQDMKAISPNERLNAVFLMNSLHALKRQIMALITTAGHGTKKFDSFSMAELKVPVPPIKLQNQFAAIVEKVEDIKGHYQQSLTDLEALYGVLSQKAFAGELDLSRVQL